MTSCLVAFLADGAFIASRAGFEAVTPGLRPGQSKQPHYGNDEKRQLQQQYEIKLCFDVASIDVKVLSILPSKRLASFSIS